MLILGIETSCDETSASLVKNGTKILSNVVASSLKLHLKTGGIIPEMAAREQIVCIVPVIQEALSQAHLNDQDIDAIAVTTGPGLIGSLLVGVETAKTLAYLWYKPLIPVNHLLAHVYANWLIPEHSEKSECQTVRPSDNLNVRNSDFPSLPSFPNIALIVSGGHTELILMSAHGGSAMGGKDHGKYEWLGGTRDDAAGECFDKVARLLDLGYPGGPAIAAAASVIASESEAISRLPRRYAPRNDVRLPRPMIDSDDFDFSFSGLKTAVLREVSRLKTMKQLNNETIAFLAYEVQEAITDVLVEKTVRAARENNVKHILLSGGVAANSRLREKFKAAIEQSNKTRSEIATPDYRRDETIVFAPPPSLCTDNAAAIAGCAFFNYKPVPWQEIKTNPSLTL